MVKNTLYTTIYLVLLVSMFPLLLAFNVDAHKSDDIASVGLLNAIKNGKTSSIVKRVTISL